MNRAAAVVVASLLVPLFAGGVVLVVRAMGPVEGSVEASVAVPVRAPADVPAELPSAESPLAALPVDETSATAGTGGAIVTTQSPFSVERAVEELAGPDPSPERRDAIWDAAHASGRIDEVLERFAARADARRDDAEAQADLGHAYLARLRRHDGGGGDAWAERADAAFDRALAVDPAHWRARLAKAAALALWPPIFGKGPEAVRHLEIVIRQTDAAPLRAAVVAEAYLVLGNLLARRGDRRRALDVWCRGLERHPESEPLRAKVR